MYTEYEWTIKKIVKEFKEGHIVLPEMQRMYVWGKPQAKNLLDSIYRGYPTGSILLWKRSAEGATQQREAAIEQETSTGKKLLLDGQQRLTSLCAALTGERLTVGRKKFKIDIMFNMNHPVEVSDEDGDESEDLKTDASLEKEIFSIKKINKPNWISVSRAFSTDLSKLVVNELKNVPPSYIDRIEALKKINYHPCHVVEISDEIPYAEAVKIFVRINSKGTKLRGSDLALAQLTSIWPSTADKDGVFGIINNYSKKLEENNHEIDAGIVVRNLVAFATNQGSLNILPSLSSLQDNWKKAEEGMNDAIDFLTNHVGFESLGLLSSHFSLIAVAKCLCARGRLPKKDKEKLKSWIILANLKGRYSLGSSVTWLSRDIGDAEDIGLMIKNLRTHVGRLRVESSDLSGQLRKNNSYIKILYFILKKEGAKDWRTTDPISWSTMSDKNKLESHHIFPQSQLKSKECSPETRNNIANLAFITRETNKWLRDRLPEDYLPEIKPQLLEKHLIPLDPDLWKIDNYPSFLKERQKLIAEKMNSYLNIEAIEASLEE